MIIMSHKTHSLQDVKTLRMKISSLKINNQAFHFLTYFLLINEKIKQYEMLHIYIYTFQLNYFVTFSLSA